MVFQKELYNGILNVAVWKVLRKSLHLKAYKLSIVQDNYQHCHVSLFTIFLLYIRLPLWFRGQSSWLQIQRPMFVSRRYHIF
jgi:hypothetical protein